MELSENPLSFGDGIPEQELQSRFTSISVEPAQGMGPKCRVALPKDWGRVPVAAPVKLAVDQMSILAAFAQSEEVGVQVLGTLLPWEVNLVDWLEYQAHLRQITLKGVQSGDTDWGQTVHALGTGTDGAILRIVVAGDGPQVIVLMGRMPPGSPRSVEQTLGLAAASLDFPAHSGKKTREPLGEYKDDAGLFQLVYPSSWGAQPLDSLRPAKSGVDLRVTSQTDTLAYLRVAADTRPARDNKAVEQLYHNTLEELNAAGIEIGGLERVSASSGGPPEQRWVGGCTLPSGEGQLAILLRLGRKAWLVAVLVCPAKTLNPYAWMRGKRAFEIAYATLR